MHILGVHRGEGCLSPAESGCGLPGLWRAVRCLLPFPGVILGVLLLPYPGASYAAKERVSLSSHSRPGQEAHMVEGQEGLTSDSGSC